MTGCHNCKYNPHKGTQYQNSKCSKCKLCEEEHFVPGRHFDPFGSNTCMADRNSTEFIYFDDLSEDDIKEFREKIYSAILNIAKMAAKNKILYNLLEARILYPYASYTDLARIAKCSKQNIFYHFRRMIKLYPMLSFFIYPTRRRHNHV